MLSALALVIWLTIALVITLDYPFSGLIHVTDDVSAAVALLTGATPAAASARPLPPPAPTQAPAPKQQPA